MAIANRRVQSGRRPNAITHANGLTNTYGDCNGNSDADNNSHRNPYGNSNINSEADANAQICTDSETSSNTCPTSVAPYGLHVG